MHIPRCQCQAVLLGTIPCPALLGTMGTNACELLKLLPIPTTSGWLGTHLLRDLPLEPPVTNFWGIKGDP